MEIKLQALRAIQSGKCKKAKTLSKDHYFIQPPSGPSGKRVTAKGPKGEDIIGDLHKCYYCGEHFFVPIDEKFIGTVVTVNI